MADVTKDSFVSKKTYRQVLMQQGRPLLDFEVNELQQILAYLGIISGAGSIGNFPWGDGLQIIPTSPVSGDAIALAGKFFNYGNVVESFEDIEIKALSQDGTTETEDFVYYVWKNTEISFADDPDIYDDVVNIETARRLKQIGSVNVSRNGNRLWLGDDSEAIFLAKVIKPVGVSLTDTSNIFDLRFEYNQNYVIEGFHITNESGRDFTVNDGKAMVANVEFNVLPKSFTAPLDSMSYVWVDEDGEVNISKLKPAPPATLLYSIRTDASGTVVDLNDLRMYYPPLLAMLRTMLMDYLSPKRQLYAGDTTTSSVSTNDPYVLKTFTMYNDAQIGFKISEVGFIIQVKASGTLGHFRLKVDGNIVHEEDVLITPDPQIFKVWTPVSWPNESVHEIELEVWSDVNSVGVAGTMEVLLFEGYVRDSSYSRRVLVFGDEGLDTISSASPVVLKSVSMFSDNQVGLNINRINYVAELYAEGGNGVCEIFIDGTMYRQFAVQEATSFQIYTGIIPVTWQTKSIHTVEVRLTAPSGGTIYNRLLEFYVDQM